MLPHGPRRRRDAEGAARRVSQDMVALATRRGGKPSGRRLPPRFPDVSKPVGETARGFRSEVQQIPRENVLGAKGEKP